MPRVAINNISWNHPDGSNLFSNINFSCSNEKTGLTGVNGIGKSLLTKIITGKLTPAAGSIYSEGKISILPQNPNFLNNQSLFTLFDVEKKLQALNKILNGTGNSVDYDILDNDWSVEERVRKALSVTGIDYINPNRFFETLSGGEKVRALFASLIISEPDFIILDEPTNHLDYDMRNFVYDFVKTNNSGMLIISHDRDLLRLMDRIVELNKSGVKVYGGDFDFYYEQKKLESDALSGDIAEAEKQLIKRVKEKESAIKKQELRLKAAARKSANGGIPKIMLNNLKGWGEQTLHKTKDIHQNRVLEAEEKLDEAKKKLTIERKIKIDFANKSIPETKIIVNLEEVNFSFGNGNLWANNLTLLIRGGERLLINGKNGSGKSTLIKIICGELIPNCGVVFNAASKTVVLDQTVSLLNDNLSVLENVKQFAGGTIPEHELRIRLARFLFFNDDVFKIAGNLSGGERMRAGMAAIFASNTPPELLIMDEPANNLDLASVDSLTQMLNDYKGTLILVSHDRQFVSELGVTRIINL